MYCSSAQALPLELQSRVLCRMCSLPNLVWSPLQLVPPTTVAVLRAMELVVAFGLQAVVTSVLPDQLDMVGAGLVILGVTATALEENLPSWRLRNFPSWRLNHNSCSGLTRRR